MSCESKSFKNLLILVIGLTCQFVMAQDTLVYLDGRIQYGRVIGIDKEKGVVYFQENETRLLISLSLMKSYTTNNLEENWKVVGYGSLSPANKAATFKMNDARRYLGFEPGKYSIGFNLMSLPNPAKVSDFNYFRRPYSTNRHLEFFFQMEINKKRALRFPVRIGINPLNKTLVVPARYDFYNSYSRELIWDVGIEPIFYLRGLYKMTWFGAPSLSLGLGRVVNIEHVSNPMNVYIYEAIKNSAIFRVGGLYGFQYWFSKSIQLEMSYGLFLTNNTSFDRNTNRNVYFGGNLRGAISCRF